MQVTPLLDIAIKNHIYLIFSLFLHYTFIVLIV
jgi:hypothetical protein